MDEKLKAQDLEVVFGDLLVSLPGDGTVRVPGAEVFKLAAEKGERLPDDDDDENATV